MTDWAVLVFSLAFDEFSSCTLLYSLLDLTPDFR